MLRIGVQPEIREPNPGDPTRTLDRVLAEPGRVGWLGAGPDRIRQFTSVSSDRALLEEVTVDGVETLEAAAARPPGRAFRAGPAHNVSPRPEALVAANEIQLEAAGRRVRLSSPDKVLFPEPGWTKLDIAEHYLRCAPGAVRGVYRRPCSLKRWPGGVTEDPFFTKRVPKTIRNAVDVQFPSARPGRMAFVEDVSDIIEQVQLGVLDLNPWTSRAGNLDQPDELRLDLDPTKDFDFDACREVAAGCRDLLAELGLVGWPKTSGSRGIHVYVRLQPRWSFNHVRRAVLALGREMERRLPGLATTEWWKEQRRGVFIDYNQNARDKTIASAYSVRHTGLVSTPFTWDELETIDPAAMTLDGFAARWQEEGDLTEGIDEAPGDLTPLLAMVAADEARGLGDAPWPPHYRKQPGEPPRVQPSKRRKDA